MVECRYLCHKCDTEVPDTLDEEYSSVQLYLFVIELESQMNDVANSDLVLLFLLHQIIDLLDAAFYISYFYGSK